MPGQYASYAALYVEFLTILGELNRPDRHFVIETSWDPHLKAISEVAFCVRNKKIRIHRRDKTYFREAKLLLRFLASPIPSTERKKRRIIRGRDILPRLLRPEYVQETVEYFNRHRSFF